MKKASKRQILFIVLGTVLVCVLATFLGVTHGFLREHEGQQQPALVYVSELRFEGGRIGYYICNATHHKITVSRVPERVEKMQDGEWRGFELFRDEISAPITIGAFDKAWIYVSMDYSENIPGEYRLIHSAVAHGEDPCSVVAQLTVTERDVWWFGQEKSFSEVQGYSTHPDVRLTLFSDGELKKYPLSYTVTNDTDAALSCRPVALEIERYDPEAKKFVPAILPLSGEVSNAQRVEIAAFGESERLALGVREPSSWEIAPSGVYRVAIPCQYAGDDDVFYAVAYFTL